MFNGVHTFPHPALSPFIYTKFKDVNQYNMLTSHIIFSENQIRQLLPKDAKFVTVLREPFNLLQSVFKYYGLCSNFNLSVCSLSDFLADPKKYDKKALKTYVKNYGASYTRNFMAQHLGFDDFSPSDFNMSHWIDYIDERFDFIRLTELLPESLIYIRRLLHWDMKNVIHLTLRNESNRGIMYKKTSTAMNVSKTDDLASKYRQWSPVDHLLYDHFLKKFQQRIKPLGDDFKHEVNIFRRIQSNVSDFCSKWCPQLADWAKYKVLGKQLEILRNTTIKIASTKWNSEFTVSLEDCLLMMLDPDAIRNVVIQWKTQICSGPECRTFLAFNLPFKSLQYLACVGRWTL